MTRATLADGPDNVQLVMPFDSNAIPAAANTVTVGTGTLIMSGYDFFNKTAATPTNTLQLGIDLLLGSNIAGVSDTLVLVAQATAANIVSYYASLTWEELV